MPPPLMTATTFTGADPSSWPFFPHAAASLRACLIAAATAAPPAPSAMILFRSTSSLTARAASSSVTTSEPATRSCASGHIDSSTHLDPQPSTHDAVYSTTVGWPAARAADNGAAVSTSHAYICTGARACPFPSSAVTVAAVSSLCSSRRLFAIPHDSAPPPYGVMTASTAGRSSHTSHPMEPLPASTCGEQTGWTKRPSCGALCVMMICHHSSKVMGTTVPPMRRMASSFICGAWSGTKTVHGTGGVCCAAIYATPCAMLPADAVTTPCLANSAQLAGSARAAAMAAVAARSLNDAMGWRFSSFSHTRTWGASGMR
mmetsp:Transcript_3176/g.7442  ORF Transcript_3176/g.7442 Transcript_3176/m.7442 type:complete len:317 (-) Transcript_3176:48-998(-)